MTPIMIQPRYNMKGTSELVELSFVGNYTSIILIHFFTLEFFFLIGTPPPPPTTASPSNGKLKKII